MVDYPASELLPLVYKHFPEQLNNNDNCIAKTLHRDIQCINTSTPVNKKHHIITPNITKQLNLLIENLGSEYYDKLGDRMYGIKAEQHNDCDRKWIDYKIDEMTQTNGLIYVSYYYNCDGDGNNKTESNNSLAFYCSFLLTDEDYSGTDIAGANTHRRHYTRSTGEIPKIIYLYELQISKNFQSLGYGSSIILNWLTNVLKDYTGVDGRSNNKSIQLTCFSTNHKALHFYYNKCGFIKIAEEEKECYPDDDQPIYFILKHSI
ncbi:uncharacterized protein SCODWIG_01164 [Saccharomycodes ludwigii]|uniref:Uncharacterized protein n=1 Tax=Saccharomycodes ludwigii TaxID=36035 RepID=A0A376B402_9ASCO|nr:hypothetical protein SCDLUD_005280 [Saccharomycodes ludwigii]KAH3898933.1 hypothetical protein SCDLUD_005280 [Saccharomycodes ludwigii]SSD59403.1 uncharacterized protein SCODWIG_01164 [Saccharomycodes ludwigii]